jgi:hypothetical protein
MKEQRLVVSHEEMIELQVEVGHKEGDPVGGSSLAARAKASAGW